ncbi:opioid growth factor receptor-like protein 1 isoform X2 [Spea bombifrons]|uniref:opioid growth factor receptor-like protein 1 isoform X2 n=1 Tax=Spea bombifrons TaxID=233779 RepID=UPI00234B5DA6|nr:opioid growth factor receptor-like protein 1 isoform X2 [Spea bombifrons]
MGNLLNGVSFKEPTTVEECDSTWETDSGGEDEQEGEEEEVDRGEKEEEAKGEQKTEDGGSEDCAAEEILQGGLSGEAEEKTEGARSPPTEQNNSNVVEQNIKPKRSFYAARDLYKYRHQYPNLKDLRCQNDLCNLRFYMNKIPFKPDGVYIEEILNKWKGDYDKLEHNHTYIQWLFPLREQGLNFYAKELTSYEIEEFKKTKEASKRFVLAYKMMLDFFGLKLMDKNGNVSRASVWQDRFQHLNESQHNYLRITRILKSLGELGYENFKFPLVKIFLQESIVENTIPNMKQSTLEYFVYTIKDRKERRRLLRFACHHYQPPEHFIWGPPKKQQVEENKATKKTIPPTRSLKKHSLKSKDAKSMCTPDSPECMSSKKTEGLTKQPTPEVNTIKEILIQSEDTTKCDNDLKVYLDTNETTSLDSTKHLEGQEPENLQKMCDVHNVVIVEALDEGTKDCLCSLSPATINTAELAASPKQDLEPDLETKDGI